MAYVLKYTSNFYNIYKKYVEVEISKWNYTTPVIPLRNTEVYIEVNYQDNNTPIIGTGCSIVIINQGEFTDLEDLLTSTEKQFKCVIKYAGVTVFQGFSICDLNEQQFNKLSRIKLQFTDYLRRLEGHFATNFFVGSNTDLLTLLQELIVTVGFGAAYQLYVNSTLFETTMNNDVTDTFLKQTYVENNMYFSDVNTYDDVYAAVNKTLKSFGCFLYSCGNKWILERQEDVTRDKNTSSWVVYTLYQVPTQTASLKEEYNKQEGDFQYADESQVLEYASGLRTLIIKLKDKQYDTFVFNDFSTDMATVSDIHPEPGTLQYRRWYANENILQLQAGFDYRDISSFIKWSYPPTLGGSGDFANMGLYYTFQVQFTASIEEPVILNIDFKMSGELDMTAIRQIDMRFVLRLDGGSMSGYYLFNGPVPPDNAIVALLASSWSNNIFTITQVDVSTSGEKVWSVSTSFNLTDTYSSDGSTYTNIWDQLGNPATQKFMIYFFPTRFYLKELPPGSNDNNTFMYSRINYLGDVSVTVTTQKVLNKLTYYINEDFVKTEEIDIDFFDLDNVNFANGFMYGLGGIGNDAIAKTALWTSEKCVDPQPLMDIYAKNKFRNYARTIHKLKAKILHDGYMKPLSVLTDDNVMVDRIVYPTMKTTFILQSYIWDLFNGVYDIVAEEYTAEDILLNEEADSGGGSSGGGWGDPGVVPPVPTSLLAQQPTPGEEVYISWDATIGASGFILQRKPSYNITGPWVDVWVTIYEGDEEYFVDYLQLESNLANGTTVSYRVLAKTTEVFSAYSGVYNLIWAA